MKKIALGLVLTVVIVFVVNATVFAAPWDVRGHWAEEYITTLVNQNVMNVYDDGQFKPNKAITRGEFAEALAKSLYIGPENETDLTDIAGHPAKGYIAALVKEGIVTGFPDKTFRPNDSLTRAQVVTMLSKALGLSEQAHQINMHSFASYLDMHEGHWATPHVKMASELGILNGYPDGTFRPQEETTRGQAAKMIGIFNSYTSTTGYIADVYPSSNKLAITTLTGERVVTKVADTALIGRNNRLVPITDFLKTDKIFVIRDQAGEARYVKAYGLITKADLSEEVSQRTGYLLDPFEIEALAKGDYEVIKPKMMNEIRAQMLRTGMTDGEIESIFQKDWNSLEQQGKERLAESIAQSTSLPLDMVYAVMAQDWAKVKALAQVEALNRAVQGIVNSNLFADSGFLS